MTLKSDVALTCQAQPVKCKVSRISFQLPAEQVTDWDDRLHTVKWVDATRGEAATWPVKKKVRSTAAKPLKTDAYSSRPPSLLVQQFLLPPEA